MKPRANQLCHRVAIIHRGRIAANDSPQSLRLAIEFRRCAELVFAEAPGAAPPVSDPAALLEVIAGGAGGRVYARTPG